MTDPSHYFTPFLAPERVGRYVAAVDGLAPWWCPAPGTPFNQDVHTTRVMAALHTRAAEMCRNQVVLMKFLSLNLTLDNFPPFVSLELNRSGWLTLDPDNPHHVAGKAFLQGYLPSGRLIWAYIAEGCRGEWDFPGVCGNNPLNQGKEIKL